MQTFNRIFACALLFVTSQVMFGQSGPSVSKALDFWVTNAEKEIVGAAAAMPEEKYDFAPTGGEFSGVRTFGEQVKHLAANNYRMAAYVIQQKPNPEQEDE